MDKNVELDLVQRIKQGDESAFTILYNHHYKLIRYIISTFTKDDHVIDDLTSITFTKAFQKIESYVNPISFEMWLKTIANNTAIDYIRKMKDQQGNQSIDEPDNYLQLPSTFTDPEQKIINSENLEQLKQAMTLLRSKYRELIELRYYKNYTYEQLADHFGVPQGTIKSDLHKAKKRLRHFFHEISNSQ